MGSSRRSRPILPAAPLQQPGKTRAGPVPTPARVTDGERAPLAAGVGPVAILRALADVTDHRRYRSGVGPGCSSLLPSHLTLPASSRSGRRCPRSRARRRRTGGSCGSVSLDSRRRACRHRRRSGARRRRRVSHPGHSRSYSKPSHPWLARCDRTSCSARAPPLEWAPYLAQYVRRAEYVQGWGGVGYRARG